MNATKMKQLVKDGQAYLVTFRWGELARYNNAYYKKNGQSYEEIEDSSLLDFLMREYEESGLDG